jgi:hypothetical protein
VWEIDIPFMGWNIRALGQVTQIAKVTVIDHLPVVLAVDTIDPHGRGFIDQIEQSRERVTQVYATTAAMADIEDPFEFIEDG